MFQYLYIFIAGLAFGLANIIPGVSGGTIAVVFGIYARLIGLIADFRKKWKKELGFIIPLGIGAGAAIIIFGKLMNFVLEKYPVLANSFFVGVIIASMPMLIKKTFIARRKHKTRWIFRFSNIFPMLVTLAIMIAMVVIGDVEAETTVSATLSVGNILIMMVYGIVASACMIIPGISGSFVMVMMGAYGLVINAVATLYFPLLIPFGIGALIGIFGCAKLIRFLLAKHEKPTYSAILGFVIGSIPAIFPAFSEIGIGALICFAVGIAAIVVCNRFSAE